MMRLGVCVSPKGRRSCEAPAGAPMEVEGRTVGHSSRFVMVRKLSAMESYSRESPHATRPPSRSATSSPAPFPPLGTLWGDT